ncbi:MAG TPA: exodeoxyribonuclease V subunit gamma [Nocardioidaceae bacterium]|nr:exodeoxyribonuclease V subunit gamma [Nocardioidaceae bacterium]
MLTIHRSERADRLVRALADVLAVPPTDPFTPEVVAVPSKGVERWISQSLAARLGTGPGGSDGVCANVHFPAPARLVAEVVARACGVDPADDPWSARRLTWPLLDVIDGCASEAWCVTLGQHVGAVGGGDVDHRRGRRVAVARKIAGLFSSYSAQRPDLVRGWLDGDDGEVPRDLAWQPELFRRLRSHLGSPGPAERLVAACDALRADGDLVALPERISFFGPTRLTIEQLMVVDALAVHRDVHLWLPHPSPGLWDRLEVDGATRAREQVPRKRDSTAALPRHPLVSSLGRDTRELQLVLAQHCPSGEVVHHAVARDEGARPSLLRTLQLQIHGDSAPTGDVVLQDDDRSLQVHACHGRLRQVEVMREAVLGILADDPTLELRDIIVMCPDIEAVAPLVSATFGLVTEDSDSQDGHPAHRLRIRLADRSLRQTNPVLEVLSRVLDLADARVTASEVLDLATVGPVRRRFRFDDDELERLADWVGRAGVRWGLDAAARAPYQLDGVSQNTWQAGLDRLLLGVAMDEEDQRTFGGVLPLDDVDSGDIDLAGRLAELVDRLACIVDELRAERPLRNWVDALTDALDGLVDVPHRDGWQLTQARSQLHEAVEAAGDRGDTVPLLLSDVRTLLADLLRGRPTRSGFRTGHLTMCSMVPMRAVPHRVVIVLGLDDSSFPRQPASDGDDLLARSPLVGEHDARSEDRQLFLDAILAAEDRLVVLYTGHDERTGAPRPPSVPLGELLDVLELTAPGARNRIVVHHPLQTFDPRNFESGRLMPGDPFSFDPAALAGGRALTSPRQARAPFVPQRLTPTEPGPIALTELTTFLASPAKAFLQHRLGLALGSDDEGAADAMTVDLRGLQEWQVGDRMLTAALRDADFDATVAAELARGSLPPGPLGRAALDRILAGVNALVRGSRGLRSGAPQRVDVDVDLGGGVRLQGAVPAVYGDRIARIEYSKLGPRHRLTSWLHLLALTVHDPTTPWQALVAGRGDRGEIAYAFVGKLEADVAHAELERIVQLYHDGLCAPLPIGLLSSACYAERRHRGTGVEPARLAARELWDKRFGGDRAQPENRMVWGDVEFDVLLAEPDDGDEGTRFGALARRLWQPLLEVEGMGSE